MLIFNWLIALSMLLITSGCVLLIAKYIDGKRDEKRRVLRSLPKNAIRSLTSKTDEDINIEDNSVLRKAHK